MSELAKWYVVHTYSGYENSVAANILKAAENRKMQDLIQEVNIPMETVKEITDSGEKTVERKVFPGYVLVKMVLTDESWHLVHNVRGAAGFVGSDGKAIPLTEQEIYDLGVEHHEVVVGYELGDSVKITDGPLEGFIGTVDELEPDKDRVRVVVSMFGRETPVDLELDQVEAIKDLNLTRKRCFQVAQKIVGYVRFQVPAGKATPAPPVGPALGQYGINIGQFTKDFNERTKGDMGMMIPVVITVYADRSFSFITKTPPAALLIKKACGIEHASGVPQRDKVATISKEDLRKIAEQKMPDLNCSSIESAMSMIAGTCRSMGVLVGE